MPRLKGNAEDTALRRKEILDASMRVFASHGFRGSTLRLIALAIDMTEAGILHHFGSKVNLLIEVLRNRDGESRPYLHDETRAGQELVADWINIIKYNSQHRETVELFAVVSTEATDVSHPAHEFFKERYARVTTTLTQLFDKLDREQLLREKNDSEETARRLIALSDGIQIQWLLDSKIDMTSHHKHFFKTLMLPSEWQRVENLLN